MTGTALVNRQSWETPEAIEPDDAESIAERLRVNGFVILEDAIPLEAIAAARAAFMPLLEEHRRTRANRGQGRHHVAIPFVPPFAHPLLFSHPLVIAVCARLLGSDVAFACYASDTPDPGTGFQPVHRDEPAALFPDAPGLATPPFEITLNIPLVDVTEENGPLELWPGGTHWVPDPQSIEQAAARMGSVRATMRAGSVILRDLRTWHRGTPNRSLAPRPMLSLAYARAWFRYHQVAPVRVDAGTFAALPEDHRRLLRFAVITA